jgi:glycosyltransferase involved in cell wall biosynthesis
VAFVMPSRWESFSIATLEAMAQRTPVLVNGGSPVLAQHAARSGAGRSYTDDESFCRALDGLLDAPGERAEMGERGRAYVLSRYQAGHIREALVREVESLTPGRTHRAALGLFRHFLACSLRAGVY